jgi:hypothetical protein
MIFKNNDTRVEKPYDTRICRNMIIIWATLSIIIVAATQLEKPTTLAVGVFQTIEPGILSRE